MQEWYISYSLQIGCDGWVQLCYHETLEEAKMLIEYLKKHNECGIDTRIIKYTKEIVG